MRYGKEPLFLTKRVYDPVSHRDGTRVLVDRLWPRGHSKSKAGIDLWLKEVGPSHELRKWFGHDPQRWEEFQRRYHQELAGNGTDIDRLIVLSQRGVVTLLYAARDREYNNAVALQNYLTQPSRVLDITERIG